MNSFRVSAPGKLILFGEHSVVHGKLAIAAAVNKRAIATASEQDGIIIVDAPDYSVKHETKLADALCSLDEINELREKNDFESLKRMGREASTPLEAVIASALERVKGKCIAGKGIALSVSSDVPKESGLGSGSAAFVASAGAVLGVYGRKLDPKTVADIAYVGDVLCHGKPSGIDNNTVAFGGYLAFKKSNGPMPLKINPKIRVVIGSTGVRAPTSEMVQINRYWLELEPDRVKKIIEKAENIAERGVDALREEDMVEIGKLANENHVLLRELGVSHPAIEELVIASLKAGALGAKLSGAGGGGIMFAVCEDDGSQKRVADAIQRAGGTPIITKLGAEGVRKEAYNSKTIKAL
ncbi:mevalonate kinase [archaeon]|nr:mevalonate kinase [archaeon]